MGNSDSEMRDFQDHIGHFLSTLEDIFSSRDLNRLLLQDFIRGYLQKHLYENRSEKLKAFEFVIISSEKNNEGRPVVIVQLINFMGEVAPFMSNNNFEIFGCYDPDKKKMLAESFRKGNIHELSLNDAAKLFEKEIDNYKDVDKGPFFLGETSYLMLPFVKINKK